MTRVLSALNLKDAVCDPDQPMQCLYHYTHKLTVEKDERRAIALQDGLVKIVRRTVQRAQVRR